MLWKSTLSLLFFFKEGKMPPIVKGRWGGIGKLKKEAVCANS
jgi:hypothetical protein